MFLHQTHYKILRGLFISFFIILIAGCSSPHAIIDYDTQQNFSQIKHFRWATPEETRSSNQRTPEGDEANEKTQSIIEDDASIPHQDLLSKRIRRTISGILAGRKIYYDPQSANTLIAYQITTQSNVFRNYYYDPYDIYFGGCSRHGHFCTGSTIRGGDVYAYRYTDLYLVLRFLKPGNQQSGHEVIWQGIIELPKNMDDRTAQEYDTIIRERISKLLQNFPPTPPGT